MRSLDREKVLQHIEPFTGWYIAISQLNMNMQAVESWYQLTGKVSEDGYPIGRIVVGSVATPLEKELFYV